MAIIKEPNGIDFSIKSMPLTDQARSEISNFIQSYKAASRKKKGSAKGKASGLKPL